MNVPSDLWLFCLGAGLLFAGVIGVAVAAKWREIRRARDWPRTSGVVLRSRVRSKKRYDSEGRSSFENQPLVEYEYQVGDQTYHATRINFADRISGQELTGALRRYPAGKRVQVYYNPDEPGEAVLERDFPQVVWMGAGLLIAFFVIGALLFPLALGGGAGWLEAHMPQPENALFVALLLMMALFCLLMTYAIQRQVWTARRWSVVEGKILSVDSEAYQSHSSNQSTTLHRASVVYAYSVDGQQYLSDRVSLGGQFSSSSPRLLRGSLQKYAEDSPVTVYYDPQDPSEAVLERRGAGAWFILVVAAGLILLAVWAGGWI